MSFDVLNPLPVLLILTFAFGCGVLLTRMPNRPSPMGRTATIDGLRGYLALAVFIHHSAVWYFYLRTGQWKAPPSRLYTHLGDSSVVFFFMITGHLFFGKLIDGRRRPIDWAHLFVGSVLRLWPLYLIAMSGMLFLVAILSHGRLDVPLTTLLIGVGKWLGFTIIGTPDLNGVRNTWRLVAGVTWSLVYEWLFYISLPALALLAGTRSPWALLSAAGLAVAWRQGWVPPLSTFGSFLGGLAAALLVRLPGPAAWAKTPFATGLVLASLTGLVFGFDSGYGLPQFGLAGIAFVTIACGNSIGGILTHAAARALGELAYSVYLLHGLILFVAFEFVIGATAASNLSPLGHWVVIAIVLPGLIALCRLTYACIEAPAMRKTAVVTEWLRNTR